MVNTAGCGINLTERHLAMLHKNTVGRTHHGQKTDKNKKA